MKSNVPNEFQLSESIEMNNDPKSGESSKSQLCAELESIKTNVKPGESSESQLSDPVSNDKVDVTLCNLQPRIESLLQSVPVDWQSFYEADAVQLQSQIKDYADVFAMDHLELGRTELV